MWEVLWLSRSSERTRPYVETLERKLREVGFLGTSSKSNEEIKKFQRERVSKQLLYILTISATGRSYTQYFLKFSILSFKLYLVENR